MLISAARLLFQITGNPKSQSDLQHSKNWHNWFLACLVSGTEVLTPNLLFSCRHSLYL